MPRNLTAAVGRDTNPDRRAWSDALPEVVAALASRWSLALGEPFEPGGQVAWVAPASRRGEALVLKVGWKHTEARHEASGLTAWEGLGAVGVYDSHETHNTVALLLERCVPGTTLASRPEPEQDTVIAGLLRRLWTVPLKNHAFRPLQTMCDEWADEFEQKLTARPGSVDAGLAREGIALFRSLPASAERVALLCTDLHAGNVLAATRAVARHRPEALRRRPDLRRAAAPAQLPPATTR